MHLSLVLWMVQLLLTSTNTRPVQLGSGGGEGRGEDRDSKVTVRGNGDSEVTGGGDGDSEVLGGEDRGTTVEPVSEQELWDRGMGLTPLITVELKEEYESLANSLKQFTSSLTRYVLNVKRLFGLNHWYMYIFQTRSPHIEGAHLEISTLITIGINPTLTGSHFILRFRTRKIFLTRVYPRPGVPRFLCDI